MITSPNKLKDFIISLLENKDAQNINVLELVEESSLANYIIFSSGRSTKNISSIAGYILQELKHVTHVPVLVEGLNNSGWVFIDIEDVIVHIFHPETRERIRLEELWISKEAKN